MTGYRRFCECLDASFRRNAEKTAITYIYEDRTLIELSYSELEQRIREAIKRYKDVGICAGDRVALLLPQGIDLCVNLLSLAYYNSTAVMLNTELDKDEIVSLIEDADVTCIITNQELYDKKLDGCNIKSFDSSNLDILYEGEFNHAIDSNKEALAILFSSGTTTRARGIVIGFHGQLNQVDLLTEHRKRSGVIRRRCLIVFPIYHISGFSHLIDLVINGASMGMMKGSEFNQILEAMQIFKPDAFGMVPKFWETALELIKNRINAKGEVEAKKTFELIEKCGKERSSTGNNIGRKEFIDINREIFGGCLENIYLGVGASKFEVMNQYWKMGYNVVNTYGSTELNFVIQTEIDPKRYKDSVSIREGEDIDIKISNPNSEGVGELQVRANTIMLGYFRDEKLTEDSFDNGYFRTGDCVRLEDGEIHIVGRLKDSIQLSNGEKVSPTDAEKKYKEYLPQDTIYVVAGVPDEASSGYDKIGIFIEGKTGNFEKYVDEINKSVSRDYVISNLEYVAKIPKTSNGKIKRQDLRDLYIKRHPNGNANNFSRPLNSLERFKQYVRMAQAAGEDIIRYSAKYPLERTDKSREYYKKFVSWTENNFDVEINGLENINEDKCYIFTPNHESHYDGMWVAMRLPEKLRETIFSISADYHFEGSIDDTLYMMRAMPVDRDGDASIPMLRAYDLLLKGRNSLLIHPEGSRTRNGEIGDFHIGGAELSLYTGIQVVPVGIIGAREIYPPDREEPHTGLDEFGNKHRLVINFGSPMNPNDYENAEEMTNEMRKRVGELTNHIDAK